MGYFFLFVAGLAGLGLVRLARTSARSQKYLQSARDEVPLQIAHLSAPLRVFAQDTRMLRVSLEAPVRTVREFIEHDLDAAAEDVDGFDTMLLNLSRQVAEWLNMHDRMSESDRETLVDLGATPKAIRAAFELEGGAFERRYLRRPGFPSLDARLHAILTELGRIEGSLQGSARIYR